MSHRSFARLAACVPLALLLATACDSASNGPFPPPPALASITVTALSTTLPVNGTQQFTAVGRDANGNVVAFTPTWQIVAGGGSVSAAGLLTAGTVAATFTNSIRVSGGSITGFASFTVTPGPLTTIVVTPSPSTPLVNANQTFVAAGRDAYGNTVAITPAWSIVAGGGTIVAGTGVFTAGASTGTFANTVKATSGTVSGFATVSVVSGTLASITISPSPLNIGVGIGQQFSAVGRDAGGNIVPLSATWSVVTAAAGTISAGGVFTAGVTPGTYVGAVRAASGATSATATVTVTAAPGALASIVVTPNPASVAAGGTQQFVASGMDAAGVVITVLPAPTWTVVNGGGTINNLSGLFTAGAVSGSFSNTVRATSGTTSGFASVSVTGSAAGGPGPSFGTADPFAVLGSTAISCIGVSSVAGNVGVAPAGSVSGFPAPCVIAAPGDPVPHVNDAVAMVAQADVTPAYNALAAMPCGTQLTGVDLGGLTLAPGVYCFTSSAQLTGNVTLAGPANGLWVFQVASALTTGTSSQVILSGGAQAKNVYWQIGTSATIGQTTIFRGNIVAAVSITMVQGSTLVGRALSKAGITLDGSTITLP